jgi:hypothetical protein
MSESTPSPDLIAEIHELAYDLELAIDATAPSRVIRKRFEDAIRESALLARLDQREQALQDVGDALDGQYPDQKPCVARAVQQQREALDAAEARCQTIEAQLAELERKSRTHCRRCALSLTSFEMDHEGSGNPICFDSFGHQWALSAPSQEEP